MANSDLRRVRHVRCPKCHSLLQEPSGVPVYQCGGCGATLRAKNRSSDRQDAASAASPSRSGLLGSSGDVASTSSTPTPPYATGTTSRRYESGHLMSARKHRSSDVVSSSSTPDATSRRRQETNPRATSDLVMSVRKDRSSDVVASTSSSTPDVTTSSRRQQATDTTSRRESSGDLVLASNRVSEEHVPPTEKKEHEQRTNRPGAYDSSESRRERRDTGDAELNAVSPGVSVSFPKGTKDARTPELQVDSEKRGKVQAEPELPDAARKKHSGEAAAVQPRFRDRQEPAPKSAQEASEPQPSRDVPAAAAAGGKVPTSPPRHRELQAEDLAPLRQKILKTVDELKGDLSELFSKSPDLNPTTKRARPRPPRRPKQEEGHASRGATASTLPISTTRARQHGSSAARAVKPAHRQVAAAPPPPSWRGLPSRRYRRCRADHPSCDNNAQPIRSSCHRGCCCRHHHAKPDCSSCRGHHCGRPTRALHQEPSSAPRKPPAGKEAKRRPPPRHHCRPVLKGAPFIICSSCFNLVQVPADFAVSTNRLRKLRCGACSAVLSYSYRDPARKKDSITDQFSTDGGAQQPDPFAPFVDDFGLSSYSTTEDESQPLHVSRNTSFGTVDGAKQGRLHRLMGYGSASELLRHSPDLCESFHYRTTPDYDRKGKAVCIDDDDLDDSDDDDTAGVLKRGAVWPMPGVPGPGAIRIKS